MLFGDAVIMVEAQKFRQAGITISGIGWLCLFSIGILYPQAVIQNTS